MIMVIVVEGAVPPIRLRFQISFCRYYLRYTWSIWLLINEKVLHCLGYDGFPSSVVNSMELNDIILSLVYDTVPSKNACMRLFCPIDYFSPF